MCRDPEDAKDVLQDTLLAAARGLRDFRGRRLCRRGSTQLLEAFASRNAAVPSTHPPRPFPHQDPAEQDATSPAIAPDEAAAGRELGLALDAAIAALAPTYREVLILRDVEGLTAKEVAEVLGVTVDTVKSRLHRARADVRAKLAPIFPTEAAVVKPAARANALTLWGSSRATWRVRLAPSNVRRCKPT